MIILMSVDQWKKNCKKLVEPKDYVVFDATDKDTAESKIYGKYSNVTTLGGLSIPSKVRKYAKKTGSEEEEEFDLSTDLVLLHGEKISKKFKKAWTELGPMDAIYTVFMSQLEGEDKQIFVVFRNKDYKLFSSFILDMFERTLGFGGMAEDDDKLDKRSGIVFSFDEWKKDKKFFENDLKDSKMNRLRKVTDNLNDEYAGFDPEKYIQKKKDRK